MPDRPFVLVAEDNEDDQVLIVRAIRQAVPDARVEVVHDGEAALARLLHDIRQALPRLLLLDVKMPKLSGLEVLEILRQSDRAQALPIVMLSNSNQEKDVRQAYASGASGFIQKPLFPADLNRLVGLIARYWLSVNEAPPSAEPEPSG